MVDEALLTDALRRIRVRAWRLRLDSSIPQVRIPVLRGVWGMALHDLDPKVYRTIFDPGASASPRYLIRPSFDETGPDRQVEFVRFDDSTTAVEWADEAVWSAWERAGQSRLSAETRGDRYPFRIAEVTPLAWDGTPLRPDRRQPGFSLDGLPWLLADHSTACSLEFPTPLRLMRDARLIVLPTPADVTLAVLRRIHSLVGSAADPLWDSRYAWLEQARLVSSLPWQGTRFDVQRYSGSQKREVEMHGITGRLDLPAGPGPLAMLLAAAAWLHIGKGTVMGLGQVRVHAKETDHSAESLSKP